MCSYTATITITITDEQARILSISSADDLTELVLELIEALVFGKLM